jgi:anti-anti-sigma factor
MEISSLTEGDLTVFRIAGRMDSIAGPAVESAARAAVGGGAHRLVLDMSGVSYISSAGLRAILVAAKVAKDAGGGLAVFGLQSTVRDAFDVSGLGSVIVVAASDAEARDSVRA